MMNKISNLVIAGTVAWIGVVLLLNFVIPHSWFFEYNTLEADPVVCRHATQAVKGDRWSRFNIPSAGVDEIFPVGVNLPEDRYSWPDGYYDKGQTVSTWRPTVNVEPGQYMWRTTQLKLYLFRVFPVYLDEDERPVSNVFTVISCDGKEPLDQAVADAVFSAMETYIELEGYVIE